VNTFNVKISTGNAAFEDNAGTELARILRELADKLDNGETTGILRDYNGNRVGEYGTD
jgi:hypothetical protein